jgi:hypothetical protein
MVLPYKKNITALSHIGVDEPYDTTHAIDMSPRIGLLTVRTSVGARNAAGLRGLVLYVQGTQSSWLVRPYTLTTVRPTTRTPYE